MKKNLLIALKARTVSSLLTGIVSLFLSTASMAQLTGTKTVCASGCTYSSIANAITALNTSGVGSGGVNIEVTAGYTETLSAPINLTATGTASNPINIYTPAGGGANAKITAYTGSGTLDGIFTLSGSDYVTIDGIDLVENSANTTTTTQMEWGYGLLKKNNTTTPDGCSYNTIRNCTITLNKANTGTAGLIAGSTGIYMANHVISATTSNAYSDTTSNSSNYNQFLSNSISNVYKGIVLYGYSSSNATYDVGNVIGKVGQGNIITNFGGSSTAVYGIYLLYQNRLFVDGNTIKGGNLSTSTMYGIYAGSGTNATIRIRSNILTLTPIQATTTTAFTGTVYGIYSAIGSSGTNNLVEISDNDIKDWDFSNSSSSTVYMLYNTASAYTVKIDNNRWTNNTFGSTVLSCTGTHYLAYYSATNSTAGSVSSFSNNTISGYSRVNITGGAGGTTYTTYILGGGLTFNITGNKIQSNSYWSTTGTLYNLYFSTSGSGIYNISKNDISNNTRLGATSGTHYCLYLGGSTTTINKVFSNTIGNNTFPSSGFTGTVYGIYFNGSTDQNYIYGNKIYDMNAGGGTMYGIASTYGTSYIYNNMIGNLSASYSNNVPAIRGIDISAGTASNVYYNTVYIPATSSSGTSFSSAALYTSTSVLCRLSNNIFINLATPGSAGRTVAHWRNGISPDYIHQNSQGNIYYAGTPSTTKLIYWDGTLACQTMATYQKRIKIAEMGSASENVTFTSSTGTSTDYLHVSPSTATSVESNGFNIQGYTDDFDGDKRFGNTGYSGTGSAPDIGADESNFTSTTTDVFSPAIYDISAPVSCYSTSKTVKATIVDKGGVHIAGGKVPRLYYKKGKGGSFQSVAGSLTSGNRFNGVWSFTVNYSTLGTFNTGDTAYAFCIAQDSASTPNISSFPAGATASSVNSVSVYPRDTFYFRNSGAGMGGVYTVAASGGDFTTIGAAVTALTAAGLCGPVTVNIKPGTYNEKVTVSTIAGSSRDNYIIFQSSTRNAADVTIIDNSNNSADYPAWRFNAVKYMTLRNVTILSTGATYGWGLNIMGPNTSNIKIKNCNIWMSDSTSGSSNKIALVVNGSNTSYSSGAKVDSLEIDSNYFKYGYFGIVSYGSSTSSRQDNNYFRNNTFYGAYYYGNYFYYQSGLRYKNNSLLPMINTTTMQYGLYMTYVGQYLTSAASEITENTIKGPASYSVYLSSSDNAPAAKGLFANNIIPSSASYGCYMTSANYWNVYHNTISMFGTSTYGIYNTTATNDYKNNILSLTTSTTSGYAIYNSVTNNPGSIDNNIYWYPVGTNLLYNGVAYTSTNFKTAAAGGANSKIYKPIFYSQTDLRTNFGCDLTVPYQSLVAKDYFGTTRSTTKPIAGAHEAQALTTDVAFVSLLSPSFPITAGSQKVRVRFVNNGTTSVSSVSIGYAVNGGTPVSQTFTLSTSLAQCDTTSLLLTTGYTHTSGCISIRVWTAKPNSSNDLNPSNDTSALLSYGLPVNGTFTVGGTSPNFTTINAAVNSMVCGGINGPITFNIRPGIYREKVSIPNILGASNTNWITFQSSTGNVDDVVIIDSTMSTSFVGNHYVWRFDNSKYITLRKVSLQVKGVYGWGVHIYGANSKKIKIKGCKSYILGDSASTSTFNIPLVVSGSLTSATTGAKIDSLEIDSNYFRYGYANTIIFGASSTSRCDEIYVRNNNFYGGRSLGATYYSSLSGLRFQNNFVNAKLSTSYGVYMATGGQYLTSAASEISGNKIINAIGSYAMYLSSITNSGTARGLFANNMISFESSSAGIYFTSSDFWDIYYNSLNQYTGAASYGIYNTATSNIFKNNIIAMNSASASASGYAIYCSSSVGAGNLDNNIYWNPLSSNLMYHAGAYTPSTYKTAAAGGASSFNVKPIFFGNNDLRLANGCSGSGVPFSGVTKDYYGTTRSSSAPIIGAHEVQIPTYSASATRVIAPSSSTVTVGTGYDVKVEVRNTGSTTINSLDVTYTLNGTPVKYTFTGRNIAPCGLDTMLFTGSNQATFGAGYNEVRAYTGKINSTADGQNADDTSAFYGFCAKLSGNYTINPSGSGSNNFKTFTKAVTALYTCGISGAVVFTASAGTYNEQGSFPGLIPGASKTNTVTFNGVDATKCKISYNNTSSDPRHVVQFVGVKHLRFLNIGIENLGTTYGWGLSLKANGTQGCDSMVIKGCIITVDQTSTSSNFAGIVISLSNTSVSSSGYNANYTKIDSNIINGGYYGLTWFGYSNTSTYASHRNIVSRNIFNNQYYYGMYLYYQDTMEVTSNRINNLGRSTNTSPYGMYTYYLDYVKISKNRICGQSGGYGIYQNYSTGSATRHCEISNNMINIGTPGTSNTAYGLYPNYPIYNDFVYNSVQVEGVSSTATAPYYGYHYSGTTYNNNRIYNNNFINNGLGYAIYMYGSSNTDIQSAISGMDNNNYRTNGSYKFNFNGTLLNLYTDWTSASYMGASNDVKAKNINPEFFSSCDMHTLSLALDSTGVAISGITEDIDGETRSTGKTDIGADEYTPPANNLGPIVILKPQAPSAAGYTDVWVNIKNFGFNTITSAKVNYKIGKKGTVKTTNWSGTLASLKTDTAKFTGSNQYLVTMGSKDTIYVFTSSPNGTTDGYTLNDTIWKTTCGALSGTYTIGSTASSTNFATWQEATTTLASCGISAPVIINVAAGTYTEQVLLNTVPGAFGNRTVTFRSANGNPSSVTLQYASPMLAASNYTFKLMGAKRIIIRDMTLASTGTTNLVNYGTVVSFDQNGAATPDSNMLYNNTINGMNSLGTTSLWAPIFSSNMMHSGNRIIKNTINYGSYGMYWNGPPPAVPNLVMPKGIVIDSNKLNNFYYLGVVVQYHENATITNNIITSNSPFGTKRGISFIYGAKGGNISNNLINLNDDIGYGMLVQYPSYYYTNWPSYMADSGTKKFNVINNSINCQVSTSTAKYGIYLVYPTNTNFYHNTSNIKGQGTAFYVTTTTDTSFKLMNNNFASEISTTSSFNGTISAYTKVDNNNYFNSTSGGPIATVISSTYTSASSMLGALYSSPAKSDLNSTSVNPNFISTTDLHVKNYLIATGANLGVARDIENRTRVLATPTMGAYEFVGDLKVSALIDPVSICKTTDLKTIKFMVKNVGYTPANNYYLNYRLNNGSVNSQLITSNLNSGDSVIISHSVQTPFTKEGTNTIKAFTSWPFDISTNDTFNGTIDVKYVKPSFTLSDTCAGSSVKFVSTSFSPGSTITSNTWSFGDGTTANGNTTNHSYTTAGKSYYVTIISTSSFGCVDSSAHQITILTTLVAGNIGSNQTICYNTVPSLIANSSSASGSVGPYVYQWQSSSDSINYTDISGATGLDYQPGTLTTTKYYRRAVRNTTGCGPSYTNVIKIKCNALLSAGVIGSSQTICYNGTGSALNFSTTPTGAYGTYTYQWQQSPDSSTWSNIAGQTGSTFTPSNVTSITYYKVLVFSGACPSAGTNGIKVKLYSPIAGGTIGSGQVICAGYTPAGFTQITAPSGGPGSYTFQWQSSTDSINWNNISGATSSSYSSPAVSGLTYFQRLAGNTGCPSGISNALKIKTLAKPNIVFTASNHCFNDPMPLSNSSNISSGTLSYVWKFGDGGTSTSSVPNKTYSASGTYNVTLVGTSNLGCKDSLTKSVIVATTPSPAFSFALKCQGDSAIFTDNTIYACGAGSGLVFSWDFGDGTKSNVQHARKRYNSPGTYNVKFKISLPGGFKDSITKTVVFNIKSTPSFTATNNCFPDATTYTNNSTNYASLAWSFGDGTTSTTTSSSFTKTYAVAATYTAKLVSISSFGCKDSLVKTINVYSKPKAVFSASNNCIGTVTTFNNSSSGAVSYSWNFGDGNSSSNVNPSNTYASANTYSVKLKVTSSNGCLDSVANTVTIYSNPVANFTTANVCNGFLSSFTNTSTGASTYSWDFGNGNSSSSTSPTYTYPTAGTYTVQLTSTSSNGCVNTVSKSYTVNSSPKAVFTASNTCLGNSISFNNTSTGASSNSWNFGDATISTVSSPSKTYTTAGNFNVKLAVTNSFGCKDSVTKSVTIYAKPVAGFTANNQCLGTIVSFGNTTTGANSQVWTFGDGNSSAANSPTYTYSSANTYTVKLVVSSVNSCKDSITKAITVFPRPSVSFTAAPDPICRGGLMSFANTTTNGATYSWLFGNGNTSTLTSPTNIYNVSGNYSVKLVSVSSNGCKDSLTKSVTVWPRPVASFSVNNGCTNDNLSFASNSVGAVGHEWTFGDGNTSTVTNPSKGYASSSTYSVKLIVTSSNGCKDTTTNSVVVYPRASVSFTNPTNFCVGLSATFTNNTTLSSGSMTTQWQFGDGNTSSNTSPTNTYASGGNYTVNLTVTTDKGCVNSATSSILVYSKPIPNFNASNVCAGGIVTFNNTTIAGTTYTWDFGDASTSNLTSPTHVYAVAGTYTVKLTATNANSCSDVITRTITIFANPTANFTVADRCVGQSLVFVNTSAGSNDAQWQFGDGSSSNSFNPTYNYNASGTYNVILSIKSINGCLGSVTKAVNVFSSPKAAFSVNDNGQCINGNNFVYTDNSTISSGTYTRAWALGDGSTSTAANPTKNYASSGAYNVKLIVTGNNGCKDSAMSSVMVSPKPIANFNINNNSQCFNGHLFSLSDASSITQGSITRLWNLGDGSSIGGTNVVKNFNAPGTYTFRLSVTSDDGCFDSISKQVTVHPSPIASFTHNNETQCLNGNSFIYTNTTSIIGGVYTSLWNLGDGSTIATPNASRSYASAGNYKVKLNVTTPFACKDSAYYFVRVLPNPSAITISGPTSANNGSTQVYSVTNTPGSTYNWQAVNGVVQNNGTNMIQVKWNLTGATGSVSVIETGVNGCNGSPANYNVTLTPTAGINPFTKNAFAANLYPNPSTDNFTLDVSTGDMVSMTIYDQLGREVIAGKRFSSSITMNDHNLAAGVYLVKLSTDAGKTTILRFEVKK